MFGKAPYGTYLFSLRQHCAVFLDTRLKTLEYTNALSHWSSHTKVRTVLARSTASLVGPSSIKALPRRSGQLLSTMSSLPRQKCPVWDTQLNNAVLDFSTGQASTASECCYFKIPPIVTDSTEYHWNFFAVREINLKAIIQADWTMFTIALHGFFKPAASN